MKNVNISLNYCEESKGAFYVMVKAPVDDAEKFII